MGTRSFPARAWCWPPTPNFLNWVELYTSTHPKGISSLYREILYLYLYGKKTQLCVVITLQEPRVTLWNLVTLWTPGAPWIRGWIDSTGWGCSSAWSYVRRRKGHIPSIVIRRREWYREFAQFSLQPKGSGRPLSDPSCQETFFAWWLQKVWCI